MISLKTFSEIEAMAEGGKRLALIMEKLKKAVRPGIATQELENLAEKLILEAGGTCSFKGYSPDGKNPFPSCLCVSIDEEIVHGIPSPRIVKEGNLLSLDIGMFYKGFHTDMAETVGIGKISSEEKKMIAVTKKALDIGIKKLNPEAMLFEASRAMEGYVLSKGFSVVKELCGHGIGRMVHEDPEVLNYFSKESKIVLKEGMVLCLEPMVSSGEGWIKKSSNGHSYETEDGKPACHFEHTIAILQSGPRILTRK